MSSYRIVLIIAFLLSSMPVSQNLFAAGGGGGGASGYVELKPFIVNVTDGKRISHMQLTAQVKLSGPDINKYFEEHRPAIRHAMVMLLSGRQAPELRSATGKEKLRAEALTAMQKVMQENIGVDGIEAVYFTGMIIQ